jgi:hypothetical protein
MTEPAWERLQDDAMNGRRPVYAVFFPYEMSDLKAFDRVPGRWRQVGAIQHITVWALAGTSP